MVHLSIGNGTFSIGRGSFVNRKGYICQYEGVHLSIERGTFINMMFSCLPGWNQYLAEDNRINLYGQ